MPARPLPCFVDTNIFIYAISPDDQRSLRAQQLILQLQASGALRTSTQVLQEIFVVATRKLKTTLRSAEALRYIEEIAESPVVVNSLDTIRFAASLSSKEPISFWDAMLVAAAEECGARTIYTEDLQSGRTIAGITLVNPFA